MRKYTLILLALIATVACAKEPKTTAELQRQGPDKVAIDGYSPVSYFTKGAAEKGSPDYVVSYDGVTYWLADAGQATEFESNPARYVPAHGGWCSLLLTGSGKLAVANPESFKIVDDRLLLFWSGDFKGQQISGLQNWESKFQGDEGELKLLGKADRAWSNLLSGSEKESVVFFNPGDEGRVNSDRHTAGERMYE